MVFYSLGFPYGPFEGFHDPIPPNKFYYEIHNSGYLAKMAYETSIYVNNVEWTKNMLFRLSEKLLFFIKVLAIRNQMVYGIFCGTKYGTRRERWF